MVLCSRIVLKAGLMELNNFHFPIESIKTVSVKLDLFFFQFWYVLDFFSRRLLKEREHTTDHRDALFWSYMTKAEIPTKWRQR